MTGFQTDVVHRRVSVVHDIWTDRQTDVAHRRVSVVRDIRANRRTNAAHQHESVIRGIRAKRKRKSVVALEKANSETTDERTIVEMRWLEADLLAFCDVT